jgi:hypothetical protein
MKSRYCYYPATARKIGRRVTIMDRIRRRRAIRRNLPDLYQVTGFNQPVFPGK